MAIDFGDIFRVPMLSEVPHAKWLSTYVGCYEIVLTGQNILDGIATGAISIGTSDSGFPIIKIKIFDLTETARSQGQTSPVLEYTELYPTEIVTELVGNARNPFLENESTFEDPDGIIHSLVELSTIFTDDNASNVFTGLDVNDNARMGLAWIPANDAPYTPNPNVYNPTVPIPNPTYNPNQGVPRRLVTNAGMGNAPYSGRSFTDLWLEFVIYDDVTEDVWETILPTGNMYLFVRTHRLYKS